MVALNISSGLSGAACYSAVSSFIKCGLCSVYFGDGGENRKKEKKKICYLFASVVFSRRALCPPRFLLFNRVIVLIELLKNKESDWFVKY